MLRISFFVGRCWGFHSAKGTKHKNDCHSIHFNWFGVLIFFNDSKFRNLFNVLNVGI